MSICEVPDCGGQVHAKGLCFKHYMRVQRHGSPTAGRNGDGRVKSTHPLWERYKSLLRLARASDGYDPRWTDFWSFVDDVGECPGADYRLYRIDDAKPYAKNNVEWRPPVWADQSTREAKNEYMRAWRIKRPRDARHHNLRRHYGITIDQYERIFSEQSGLCAICEQPETAVHQRTGEKQMLAYDHNHVTGVGRGLLCHLCNRGIGLFSDDPGRLRAAADYLDRHAGPVLSRKT